MDFAKRLAADLQARANYRVFLDLESIEKGGLWEVRIERGIKESSVLLAVLSAHAVREESVCRDEVVFALCEGKRIIPLRQDPDPQLQPPLLLARRNWVDFTADYEQGFQALLQFLKGDDSALRPPALPTITGVVPLDFGVEIARFTHGFTGREWVHREVDRWLAQDGRRAMVIVAEPGVGKSALAAWLSETRPDVLGIHFCTQQNSRTRDPYEFVACLVSHLHARLPGFAQAVEARHPEVRRPDAKAAFRELIIEPARSLPAPEHPRLIVVDSLDECLAQPNETVLDVLVDQVKDLPPWLRVIATTRLEQPILHRIRALNVFELLAERPDNRHDVCRYIAARLKTSKSAGLAGPNAAAIESRLDRLSEGNFLYARLALDALEEGSLGVADLDHLSVGLVDFYAKAFARKFTEAEAYHREIAPLLSALAVARGPMSFGLLCRVAGESPATVNLRLNRLRSWLKVQGQNEDATYVLFHKSLQDWLGNRAEAGDYWCDARAGQARLVELVRDTWTTDDYALRHLPAHLVALESWDEVVALLCDLRFVEARCRVGQVFELIADYRLARENLPEAQVDLREERAREERARRWTVEVIEYARQWSDRRDRFVQGQSASEPGPKLPEPVGACEMWSEAKIQAECRRIVASPTRLDRLRMFAGFVESQCYPLLEFGQRPGFLAQHAANDAPAGPVHEAGISLLSALPTPSLLRRWAADAKFNPKPACLRTLEGHGDSVLSVSATLDGRRAVSGSRDETVRVWDLESGACLRTLEGHGDSVSSVSVTPDGRRAVSGSWDKTVRVWDLESGACLRTLEGHSAWVRSVTVTPDGRRAVSGSEDKTVRVWDLESGACLWTLKGDSDSVGCVSVTPDGRRTVLGGNDGTIRVWDLESGACLRTLEGHSSWVWSVSVTPDGRRAVSGSHGKTVRVWDLESGACLRTLEGHSSWVFSVSVTLDGRRAVSGSDDKTVRVWDLESGACLRTLEGDRSWVISVSVTPDGRRAVSGSGDNTVRVWDLKSGARLRKLEGHSERVNSVSVTPDGRRAVSGSWDATVRVWDLDSGVCLRTLEGHSERVLSVSVTPDGRRAVSGSDDKTVRVWNLESGRCLGIYVGSAPFSAVALNGAGNVIFAGTTDGVLFLDVKHIASGPAILTTVNPQQARCPVCGQEFVPPPAIVAAIQGQSATSVQPSAFSLHHSALLSPCPHCQHPLQFNPFFVAAEDYAEVLRRGLEQSRREEGADHEETLAHLAALAAHFEHFGQPEAARPFGEEHARLLAHIRTATRH